MAEIYSAEKFFEFGKELIENAKHIEETAARLNLTTDEVQKLDHVAKRTGVSIDQLAAAFDRLAKTKQDALGGDAKKDSAFSDFGISLEEIKGMEPEEIFKRISESIEKTGINAKVTADLITLLGRSAGEFKPAMKEFNELYTKAAIIPEQQLRDLAQAKNIMADVKEGATGIGTVLLSMAMHPIRTASDIFGPTKIKPQRTNAEIMADLENQMSPRMHIQETYDRQVAEQTEKKLQADADLEELTKQLTSAYDEDSRLEKERQQIQKKLNTAMHEQSELILAGNKIERETPTAEQIAGRRFMTRLNKIYGQGGRFDLESGNGPFTGIAQQYELTRKQQLWDLIHGNAKFDKDGVLIGGKAYFDRQKQIKLGNMLGAAGLETPNMKFDRINSRLDEISTGITDLCEQAKIAGIKIQVP